MLRYFGGFLAKTPCFEWLLLWSRWFRRVFAWEGCGGKGLKLGVGVSKLLHRATDPDRAIILLGVAVPSRFLAYDGMNRNLASAREHAVRIVPH